jgi:hypothetical protein
LRVHRVGERGQTVDALPGGVGVLQTASVADDAVTRRPSTTASAIAANTPPRSMICRVDV